MTEQDLYQFVKKQLEKRAESDIRLKALLKKINEGTATFADTAQYSELFSNLLGQTLSDNIEKLSVPLAKENVCKSLLKDRYADMNAIMAVVQQAIDLKNGVNISAKKAPFPEDRVDKVAHSLEDPTVDIDVIKRRANGPVANVAKSFHDDYIKENAKFRNDAGLKCYLVRTSDGKCCDWCTKIAGRYDYATAPDDIFRRHDNCGCTTIYENGRQRQDVWTKKSWEDPEIEDKEYKPTVFNSDQANALQEKNLQYKGLTEDKESGIMNLYRGKGIAVSSDSDIAPETIAMAENATKTVTKDFKVLEKYSEPITFGKISDGLAQNVFTPSTGLNQITLSKLDFMDVNSLLNKLKTDFSSGTSYDTDDIRSLVAHELGHNAHVALALKRAGLKYGKPLSTIETYIFEKEYNNIAQEVYLAAFTNENFNNIQKQCIQQLGNMVYKNPNELIAQSFGNDYFGKNKSNIAKNIVNYFKKELR